MKKLLSLFGLLGLLAFVATPIYAQEEDVNIDDEQEIVAEAEDIDAIAVADEYNYESDEDVAPAEVAEAGDEIVDAVEAAVEETEEAVPFLGSEELENILWDLNVDEMSKEDAMATTWVLGALGGLFAGLWIAGIIFGIIWLILLIIALWKAFEKAWEAGWKAIIPIYNVYIMYKIGWMKNWFWYSLIAVFVLWLIAWFLPDYEALLNDISTVFAGIVELVAMFKFARKYGWGTFTSILFAIFTGICLLILGFWNSKYEWKEEKTVVEA